MSTSSPYGSNYWSTFRQLSTAEKWEVTQEDYPEWLMTLDDEALEAEITGYVDESGWNHWQQQWLKDQAVAEKHRRAKERGLTPEEVEFTANIMALYGTDDSNDSSGTDGEQA